VQGAHSLILLLHYERTGMVMESARAVDLDHPSALPTFPGFGEHSTLDLSALFYVDTLDRLGLADGEFERAEFDPSVSLPMPDEARSERLTSSSTAAWRDLSPTELRATLDYWRRKVPCPELPNPLVEPISLPRGCTLPDVSRSDVCYGAPRLWRQLYIDGVSADVLPGSLALEGGSTWFYHAAATKMNGMTSLARVRLETATVADITTREVLPVIASNDPNPGWSASPQVRSDALELFFEGTWPRGTAWSYGLLSSHRTSIAEPWPGASRLLVDSQADVSSTVAQAMYSRKSPLLLPDWKTLLYFDIFEELVQASQRQTTSASDLAFGEPRAAGLDSRGYISSMTLSCDRRHVLYIRQDRVDTSWSARSVAIVSLDPLAFSAPELIRTSSQPPLFTPGMVTLRIAEALDCKTLYLADDFNLYVADRIPCP
jgi:hypothetical protein